MQPACHRKTKRGATRRSNSNLEPRTGIEATDVAQVVSSQDSEHEQTDPREATPSDVWVFGSFRRNREHFGMPQSFERDLDKGFTCSKASHKKDRRLGTGWS